jgi:DNA-directed RNA polymerase specialized sigma24 family protein
MTKVQCTTELLAATLDEEREDMLRKAAKKLLWDWRAASEIVSQAEEKARASLHTFDPEVRPLVTWIHLILSRLAIAYARANGYSPVGTTEEIEHLYCDYPEKLADALAERAQIAEAIEHLPTALREAMRVWLDTGIIGDAVPESLGASVRQGLTLLGRRMVAA